MINVIKESDSIIKFSINSPSTIIEETILSGASGKNSTVSGTKTTASGENSFASGENSHASGKNSIADGFNTIASGENSHAEGYNTKASGFNSHAEGYSTTASGNNSFSGGHFALATGLNSFAHGDGFLKPEERILAEWPEIDFCNGTSTTYTNYHDFRSEDNGVSVVLGDNIVEFRADAGTYRIYTLTPLSVPVIEEKPLGFTINFSDCYAMKIDENEVFIYASTEDGWRIRIYNIETDSFSQPWIPTRPMINGCVIGGFLYFGDGQEVVKINVYTGAETVIHTRTPIGSNFLEEKGISVAAQAINGTEIIVSNGYIYNDDIYVYDISVGYDLVHTIPNFLNSESQTPVFTSPQAVSRNAHNQFAALGFFTRWEYYSGNGSSLDSSVYIDSSYNVFSNIYMGQEKDYFGQVDLMKIEDTTPILEPENVDGSTGINFAQVWLGNSLFWIEYGGIIEYTWDTIPGAIENVVAGGVNSKSLGLGTVSSGDGSLAVGERTRSIGANSHAEGKRTLDLVTLKS